MPVYVEMQVAANQPFSRWFFFEIFSEYWTTFKEFSYQNIIIIHEVVLWLRIARRNASIPHNIYTYHVYNVIV